MLYITKKANYYVFFIIFRQILARLVKNNSKMSLLSNEKPVFLLLILAESFLIIFTKIYKGIAIFFIRINKKS